VGALKRQPEPVIVVDAANCMDHAAVARRGVVYRAIGAPKRTAAYGETLPPWFSQTGGVHSSAG
jgi:hypothetical protein